MHVEKKHQYIFQKMRSIVEHAYNSVDFYRDYYSQKGFNPNDISSFEDLQKIPIVNKELLRGCPLEKRSFKGHGRYLVNTGGSSGSPLSFYILPSSIGHEWAHMHHIWSKFGYRTNDLKLCFSGRDLKKETITYDALRHHYAVNIFHPHSKIVSELKLILKSQTIPYLHGYPSALYDFACYCEENDQELVTLLSQQLKGAFLGSEYPSIVYRQKIESVFNISTVSWYGHTERAVLAWEKDVPFIYSPFQTYGFTEAVTDYNSDVNKLVATSYYNTASPLIRYDTGDKISVISSTAGILESFRVTAGRVGDYVIDSTGKKISLTGLVFGRHHKVFEKAKFFQVYQTIPGYVKIYITNLGNKIPELELCNYFDLSGINIDFTFEQIDAPILTSSGKVILNVSQILKNEYFKKA